jgi:hypothetical protein
LQVTFLMPWSRGWPKNEQGQRTGTGAKTGPDGGMIKA